LQLWSCDAESYAQSHADSCNQALQPVDVHPGHKENVYRYSGSGDPAGAAEAAMNNWWSQLARNGVPSNMQYTPLVASQGATSFTKVSFWQEATICYAFVATGCAADATQQGLRNSELLDPRSPPPPFGGCSIQ
ncbi:hypothetical protein COOONC_18905, partial [Cooperia oncophora]